jgi:hypothetical protein
MKSSLKLMNKFILTLLLIGCSVSGLFGSSSLAATPGIDLLKKNAIESFLQKANNPKTALHKKLVELNQADGRNINGIFPKTLTTKDIQIVSIDGEDQFGGYCSGIESKPEHFVCRQRVTETYLILIPSKMGVHKATDYQRFLFIVNLSKNIEWKRDANDRKYSYKESIEIAEPTQVPLEKLVPSGS